MSRERFLRLLDAAEYLAAHIHEAPVWIVPCLEGGSPTRTSGSSIYPTIQNMLLAARALDAADHRILGLIGEVRSVEIGEVVILNPVVERATG
jgi:hypothetical protein